MINSGEKMQSETDEKINITDVVNNTLEEVNRILTISSKEELERKIKEYEKKHDGGIPLSLALAYSIAKGDIYLYFDGEKNEREYIKIKETKNKLAEKTIAVFLCFCSNEKDISYFFNKLRNTIYTYQIKKRDFKSLIRNIYQLGKEKIKLYLKSQEHNIRTGVKQKTNTIIYELITKSLEKKLYEVRNLRLVKEVEERVREILLTNKLNLAYNVVQSISEELDYIFSLRINNNKNYTTFF